MNKNKIFERKFENKVLDTIEKYNLFSIKDKVLVACSGGKDSTAILYILKKHGYKAEAVTVDALIGNYTKENLKNLTAFCKQNNVKLHKISFRDKFGRSLCYMQSIIKKNGYSLKSCTICGVLRRYLLNKKARKLKPKCIVTGHNMDDEAQSIVMNMFRNRMNLSARLGPKTGLVEDSRFVPRVKPLYFVSEKDIVRYSKLREFKVNYNPCPCCVDAYRREISLMLKKLSKNNENISQNIINNFLRLLPRLKENYKTEEKIPRCRNCGEPSKGNVCNTCKIISMAAK